MDALEQGLPPPGKPEAAETPQGRGPEPEFDGLEVWEKDGLWWTEFPPPVGFDGEERGEYSDSDYQRTLTAREQAVVDAEIGERDAEELAAQGARRDRFFDLGADEISSLREAEPYETSEPSDPDPRPIEYKSLVPPGPARPPSFRRKPEPMNTFVRNAHRRRSWIPDQGRDDDPGAGHIQTPSARHPYR